jgi:hypothetical protein
MPEIPPGLARVRGLRIVALVAFALLLGILEWWPALAAYPNTQWGDGQQYHKTLEAARVAITRYHELPLWNPYECGGLPLWDNPQSFVLTPLAWLTFLIGTTRTMEIWFLVHVTLGFLCMWVLARYDLRLSRVATLVASATWAYSGFHQHHYAGGHATFTPFEYFPLAIFLWRRAERDVRYAVGLGVLVADMMIEGAVYPIPHLVAILGVESLLRAWPLARIPKLLKAGAIAGVVAFTLAACRFLPVIDQLRHHNRDLAPENDFIRWQTLVDMFLARNHPFRFSTQTYHWNEYATYLGPILLLFGVLGVLASGKELRWLVVLLVWSFVLMLGHWGPYSPWHILKSYVFPFKEMRVPSRFRAETSMFLAAFAGVALDRFPRLLRKGSLRGSGHLRAAMVALALIGVGDILSVGASFIDEYGFHEAPEAHPSPSARLYYGGRGLAGFIDEPQQNRGRLQCWDEWAFGPGGFAWEGDVPQAKAMTEAAKVLSVRRTQNTFTLEVDANEPARILLNSTYDRGFRTDVGEIVEVKMQLALDVPPGRHTIHVRYWPHGLTAGFILSALSMIGTAAFFVLDHRRRTGRSNLIGRIGALFRPTPNASR